MVTLHWFDLLHLSTTAGFVFHLIVVMLGFFGVTSFLCFALWMSRFVRSFCRFWKKKKKEKKKRPLCSVCVSLLTVWSVAVAHCWGVVDSMCSLAAVQARPGFQKWCCGVPVGKWRGRLCVCRRNEGKRGGKRLCASVCKEGVSVGKWGGGVCMYVCHCVVPRWRPGFPFL